MTLGCAGLDTAGSRDGHGEHTRDEDAAYSTGNRGPHSDRLRLHAGEEREGGGGAQSGEVDIVVLGSTEGRKTTQTAARKKKKMGPRRIRPRRARLCAPGGALDDGEDGHGDGVDDRLQQGRNWSFCSSVHGGSEQGTEEGKLRR